MMACGTAGDPQGGHSATAAPHPRAKGVKLTFGPTASTRPHVLAGMVEAMSLVNVGFEGASYTLGYVPIGIVGYEGMGRAPGSAHYSTPALGAGHAKALRVSEVMSRVTFGFKVALCCSAAHTLALRVVGTPLVTSHGYVPLVVEYTTSTTHTPAGFLPVCFAAEPCARGTEGESAGRQ